MGIFKFIRCNRTKAEQQNMNVVNDLRQHSQSFLNFAPKKRSIEEEIASLSGKERVCFETLKARWEERVEASRRGDNEEGVPVFSDGMILRFARCAPAGPFNEKSAWTNMKTVDARYLDLSFGELSAQLQTRTIFPLSFVETKEGNEVFYMRPKRYNPERTPVQDIIDNLVYVMNTMNENNQNATRGIAFIANMDGWTMRNFSIEYCHKFMQVLQGTVIPTRVSQFLIVNPPKWFGKVYAIMRKMLSPEFQTKVRMIPGCKLEKYLKPGYETYLPSELVSGRAITADLVEDFCDFRQFIESQELQEQQQQKVSLQKMPLSRRRNKSLGDESDHTTHRCEDDTTSSLSSL